VLTIDNCDGLKLSLKEEYRPSMLEDKVQGEYLTLKRLCDKEWNLHF
jgi:hypothetical protein